MNMLQQAEFVTSFDINRGLQLSYDIGMEKADIKRLMGSNLARMRRSRGLTGEKLAEMINSSPSTISNAETGRSFGDDLLARLCTALQVEPQEFFRPVPGIGYVAEEQEKYRSIDLGPGVSSFTIPDDNMAPRYLRGETVYVTTREPVSSGDFVLVELVTGETVVRQIYFTGERVLLHGVNPAAHPIIVSPSDIRSRRKVVWVKTYG
jgi:transcriptional regulator with XRE-family HTH domain